MPLGAFRINSLAKFTVTAVAEVIRAKKGITAVGNAKVSTAQSKFGGASAVFDGSGDYLVTPAHTDYNFGTDNFTIECWVRITGDSTANSGGTRYANILATVPSGSAGTNYEFGLIGSSTTTGTGLFFNSWVSGTGYGVSSNYTFSKNTWYHIAVSRTSGNIQFFVDGTQIGTTQSHNVTTNCTNDMRIAGTAVTAYKHELIGYIDELRVSNSARYSTTFTPSTTPFVNDDNTLLLIHADGTDASTYFEDDNGVRKSATPLGTGTQNISTTQSKFGGSSIFINASTGGSNSALNFLPVAEYSTLKWGDYTNYTIECWTYHTAWQPSGANDTGEGSSSVFQWSRNNGFTKNSFGFNEAGKITLDYSTSAAYGGITVQESGASGVLNTWQHIAMVKNGNSLKCYVNGTERASGTLSGTVDYGTGSEWPRIGQGYWGGTFYMNEFRCSTTARYTANFTAPTTPFVNDANTVVLLHGNGSNNTTVYRDDNGVRAPRGIVAFGNAQVDTAQSKFGGASALFDGTGDYLQPVNDTDLRTWNNASTGYTVECWFRPNSFTIGTAPSNYPLIVGNMNPTGDVDYWSFGPTSSTQITFYYYNGSQQRLSATVSTMSTGTWYHLAFTYNTSGTMTIWLNGTSVATGTVSGTPQFSSSAGFFNIGQVNNIGYNGHLDDFRISKTARYTANFTAPTEPFQNDENTLLLLHMDGTDASTVFFDDNGRTPTP